MIAIYNSLQSAIHWAVETEHELKKPIVKVVLVSNALFLGGSMGMSYVLGLTVFPGLFAGSFASAFFSIEMCYHIETAKNSLRERNTQESRAVVLSRLAERLLGSAPAA